MPEATTMKFCIVVMQGEWSSQLAMVCAQPFFGVAFVRSTPDGAETKPCDHQGADYKAECLFHIVDTTPKKVYW